MASFLWQMIPTSRSEGIPLWGTTHISTILSGISEGFVPNFGILNSGRGTFPHSLQRILGLGFFLASLLIVVRSRATLLAYTILTAGMLAICVIVYSGFRWHHGMYFLFLLVA